MIKGALMHDIFKANIQPYHTYIEKQLKKGNLRVDGFIPHSKLKT
jgi:hypothetical protein